VVSLFGVEKPSDKGRRPEGEEMSAVEVTVSVGDGVCSPADVKDTAITDDRHIIQTELPNWIRSGDNLSFASWIGEAVIAMEEMINVDQRSDNERGLRQNNKG
jgi:hypothetical protein